MISSGKHIDTQKERYDEDAEVNERLKESIRKIKAGLEAVQRQQHNDRNRLSLHTSTNQNSHSGVVISSIAETAVFIISSLFQVRISYMFTINATYLNSCDIDFLCTEMVSC